MTISIGLRVYKFEMYEKFQREPLNWRDDDDLPSLKAFFDGFVDKNQTPNDDEVELRSWFFDKPKIKDKFTIKGIAQYGTFGFESDLLNTKTRKKNYRRQKDDLEQIPLYYQFWIPDGKNFGFAAFQSFQTRSCAGRIIKHIQQSFSSEHDEKQVRFKKLMPEDANGSALFASPVKEVTLISSNASSDAFERYSRARKNQPVDLQVSIRAKKGDTFGLYRDFNEARMKALASTAVVFDEVEFDKMSASVKVGKKIRKVGVFGYNSDAGLIDITESVKLASSSHPKFKSVDKETDDILSEFFKIVAEKQ